MTPESKRRADAVADFSLAPFQRIAGYYDDLVRQHGHDPKACDYGHPASQAVKFRVLAEVGDLRGKSVLDVGCGFADFADYLHDRYDSLAYTGIDISPQMVREAQRLHPGLDLRNGNFIDLDLGRFDLVTANGIFYLLGPQALELAKVLIKRMFASCGYAVAFNSLSSWAQEKEPGEFYADPVEILQFCRTLTPWVVLRHDYHPRDFTVYMYRERQR